MTIYHLATSPFLFRVSVSHIRRSLSASSWWKYIATLPCLQKPRLFMFSCSSNILPLSSWLKGGCHISIASAFQVGRRAKGKKSLANWVFPFYQETMMLVRSVCQKQNSLWKFHCMTFRFYNESEESCSFHTDQWYFEKFPSKITKPWKPRSTTFITFYWSRLPQFKGRGNRLYLLKSRREVLKTMWD